MKTEHAAGDFGGIEVDVMLKGHSLVDFDKRKLRKALVSAGGVVRKQARRLVSRMAVSSPGEFPGMQSGALRRSIKIYKRGSKGGYVKLGPTKTSEMKAFYPAFLFYGSKKMGIAPRGNYMVEALDQKRTEVRAMITDSLYDALVPR